MENYNNLNECNNSQDNLNEIEDYTKIDGLCIFKTPDRKQKNKFTISNSASKIPRLSSNQDHFQEELPPPSSTIVQYRKQKSEFLIDEKKITVLNEKKSVTKQLTYPYPLTKSAKVFRKRKSISMLDLHEYHSSKKLTNKQNFTTKYSSTSNTIATNNVVSSEMLKYSSSISDCPQKSAGFRIYMIMVLNAWRKRRDEVNRLIEELARARKITLKAKNQIHVLNSMYKIEQKHNESATNTIRHLNELLEKETKNVIEEKAQNGILLADLDALERNFSYTNNTLTTINRELNVAINKIKTLDQTLLKEQKRIFQLHNDKNKLLNEIETIKYMYGKNTDELSETVSQQAKQIDNYKIEFEKMQYKLIELKSKENIIQEFKQEDKFQRDVIQKMSNEIYNLQYKIATSFPSRFSIFCNNAPMKSIYYLHLFIFYLLPAVPPPKKIQRLTNNKNQLNQIEN